MLHSSSAATIGAYPEVAECEDVAGHASRDPNGMTSMATSYCTGFFNAFSFPVLVASARSSI